MTPDDLSLRIDEAGFAHLIVSHPGLTAVAHPGVLMVDLPPAVFAQLVAEVNTHTARLAARAAVDAARSPAGLRKAEQVAARAHREATEQAEAAENGE